MQNEMFAEIINTLTELRRMHQLNLELLEQLNVACDWVMKNIVQIPNADTMSSLLSKSLALIAEIQSDEPKMLQYHKLSDDFLQTKKSDKDFTVPWARLRQNVTMGL